MKKGIITIVLFLILLAVGLYIWITPPIGNKFYCWEDPESICESVVKDDVRIITQGLELTKDGKRYFLHFCMENHSDSNIVYDVTAFRLDYSHYGIWKTISFNLFPIGTFHICNGNEKKEDAILVSREVVSYPGRYRVYLKDVGFIEFETFRDS